MESTSLTTNPGEFRLSQPHLAHLNSQLVPLSLTVEALTKSEAAVLDLLVRGASNREIAEHSFVSENTVEYHLKNVYTKLNVSTRTAAMNAALRLGIARF